MWHEARRSEKKVHDMMDNAKKRAERRAAFLAKRRGDPSQGMRVVASKAKLHHDVAIYKATEEQQGMIPWNGKPDILIDRFDGRALLDFIREYSPRLHPPRTKTDEEEELEEVVNFERFRDLVKQRRRGLTDEEGLEDVEDELEARATSTLPEDAARQQEGGTQASNNKGKFAKIAFNYNDRGGAPATEREGSEDSGEGEEGEEEEDSSSEDSEDEQINVIGRQYGVEDFNRRVFMERKAREEQKERTDQSLEEAAAKRQQRKERRKSVRQAKDKDYESTMRVITKFNDPNSSCVMPAASAAVPKDRRASPTHDPYARLPARPRSRSPISPPSRNAYPDRDISRGRGHEREHDRDHDRDRGFDRHYDRGRDGGSDHRGGEHSGSGHYSRGFDGVRRGAEADGRGSYRDRERERDRSGRSERRPKIEFITEFDTGGATVPAPRGLTPPPSPPTPQPLEDRWAVGPFWRLSEVILQRLLDKGTGCRPPPNGRRRFAKANQRLQLEVQP
eukprot:TRINITY_DN907_c0_g1_i2.p1 TRINITY_DN907_c0_g1~~TRINITY_DN907_c0_g1_i2.p1  ORF type:complete len:506 (+),score=97.46 TRINITY_DN907_c0_g1_i2:181-1698(+)